MVVLRANCQGTGFVFTVGADHVIIMELSAPAGAPVMVALLSSEAVGLLSILQKVGRGLQWTCPADDLY